MKYKIPISILGIIIFIFIFNCNSLNTPFERDEGEYAYSAKVLLNGGLPYRDSFMQKPPMIIYTYALGQIIPNNAVWPPRFLRILFILGIVLATGLIIKKEYGEDMGIASMYLLVPMLSFPYLAGLAANTEIFMLLPLVATLLIFVLNKNKNLISFWVCFWAGFLGTMAILYKPIALLPLVFIFIFWLFEIWRKEKILKKVLTSGSFILAGIISSLLLFLGYFIIKDGGKSFWESAVVFNSYYLNWVNNSSPIFWREMPIFMAKWFPLCLLFILSFFLKFKNKWFYIGLFFSCFLMIFKSPIGHYYILLMPFWIILVAGAISSISSYFDKKWKNNKTILTLTIISLLFMIGAVNRQFGLSSEEISYWIYGTSNPFVESKIISGKIDEITKPNDYVFVGGSEPQILYYANRKSSSRFVITYPFVINTPVQLKYQKEAIGELEKNVPQAIVISQRTESGLWNETSPQDFKNYLFNLIDKKYHLVGGYISEGGNMYWQDNLKPEEVQNASLLLYKIN